MNQLTIQEVAAKLTEKAADDLIAALSATPRDKATWQPFPDTRPVLEQTVECCLANRKWANILTTRAYSELPEDEGARAFAELDTVEKVVAVLRETSTKLATVIRSLPDSEVAGIVPYPWKPETGRTLAECCHHATWNMNYHCGQVSYIQTLYGDWDEHGDIGPYGEMQAPP